MATNQDPQFIVQLPNGRKSKPQTRAAIQQMYAAGKILLPANVLCVGKSFNVPLNEFVSDSGLLNRLLGELPAIQESAGTQSFIEPASVFVGGLEVRERLSKTPELPTSIVPRANSNGPKTVRNILTIAAGILLALMILAFGFYVLWYLMTGPGSQYEKNMQKMLDNMNAENARRGLPPIEVGN